MKRIIILFSFIFLLVACYIVINQKATFDRIKLTVDKGEANNDNWQLFIDTGIGFNENESLSTGLTVGQKASKMYFDLTAYDMNKIRNLRLDTGTKIQKIRIKSLEYQKKVFKLFSFELYDTFLIYNARELFEIITPLNGIEKIEEKNTFIELSTNNFDPYVGIKYDSRDIFLLSKSFISFRLFIFLFIVYLFSLLCIYTFFKRQIFLDFFNNRIITYLQGEIKFFFLFPLLFVLFLLLINIHNILNINNPKMLFLYFYFVLLILFVAYSFYFYACFKSKKIIKSIAELRNKEVILLFFVVVITANFLFKDFLFLNKLYIYKDIGNDIFFQYLPFNIYFSEMFRNMKLTFWHFKIGVGTPLIPISGDVFNYLIWFSGKDNVPFILPYIAILKILLATLFFFLYLNKLSVSKYVSIVVSLLYGFNGYMILWGQHYHYATLVVYVAFALYAYEVWFVDKKFILFPVAIGLLGLLALQYLYVFSIFLFIYAVIRYFMQNDFNIKEVLLYISKTIGLYFVGFLIAAILLLPNIYYLLNHPRMSQMADSFNLNIFRFSDFINYFTQIVRLYSNDLTGVGDNYRGYGNYYEAPIYYCGLLSLILIPQILTINNKKQKGFFLFIISIIAIQFAFPFFRIAFGGFLGEYYRETTFFVIIYMLFILAFSLDNVFKNKLDKRLLIFTTCVLLLIIVMTLIISNAYSLSLLNLKVFNFVIVFLLFYLFILLSLGSNQKNTGFVKFILLLIVSIELINFNNFTINDRSRVDAEYINSKKGYYDNTNKAVEYIKETDSAFFRVERSYYSVFLCDPLIQNFYGTTGYFSFNQPHYIMFLQSMNVPFFLPYTNYISGLDKLIALQYFMGVKYYLSRESINVYGYEYIKTVGDINIYKNNNALPLGFTYDSFITEETFNKLSFEERQKSLLISFTAKNFDLNKLNKLNKNENLSIDYSEFDQTITNYTNRLKENIFDITSFKEDNIKGKIKIDKSKLLTFSIPFDKGWRIKINGKRTDFIEVNNGFIGIPLDSGEYNIELKYQFPFFNIGIVCTIFGILILIGGVIFNKKVFSSNMSKK